MADRMQEARERLYAALKHSKSCSCGECAGGLNAADYLADRVAELEAQQDASCARLAALETALRREWWLNHGHDFARLYGDDGEMQCAGCADFKRDSIDRLRIIVRDARMERVALAAAQEPPAEPHVLGLPLIVDERMPPGVVAIVSPAEGDDQ